MESSDKQKIADVVRARRTAKGYTQQELADLTGITLRSVQRIESGFVQPRLYTLRLLEEHLGISLQVNGAIIPERDPTENPDLALAGKQTLLGALAQDIPTMEGAHHMMSDSGEEVTALSNRQKGWSTGRKWVLTISLGLLLPLLTIAYLAQAARWPETDFEHILIWSGVLAMYSTILWKIWK